LRLQRLIIRLGRHERLAGGEETFDEGGRVPAAPGSWGLSGSTVKRDGGLDATDHELVKGARHSIHRDAAVRGP